jgi:hypothetical protein
MRVPFVFPESRDYQPSSVVAPYAVEDVHFSKRRRRTLNAVKECKRVGVVMSRRRDRYERRSGMRALMKLTYMGNESASQPLTISNNL